MRGAACSLAGGAAQTQYRTSIDNDVEQGAGTMPSNDRRMTKAQRRAAAAAEAARLALEAERRARRNRILIAASVLVGVVLVVGVVVTVFVLGDRSTTAAEATVPTNATAIVTNKDAGNKTIPGGIAVSADGVGRDDSSKVHVAVFSDYICPFCGTFEESHIAGLLQSARTGDIVLEYHPVSFLDGQSAGTKYSTRAVNAAMTVADREPDLFPAFNQALFDNQPEEGTKGLTDGEIGRLARQVGVSQATVDQFAKGSYTDWIASTATSVAKGGVTVTPSVYIDGARFGGDWRTDGALEQAIADAALSRGYTIG